MSLPTSPTNNQTTVLNGITYQYNSANSSWTRVPGVITATTNLIISGTTPATSTNTGALQVYGGVGIGGALWVGTTSYIAGAQILTTANVNTFVTSGVSSINAGTDTAVNQTTGAVTIWNTSTLQTITSRGSSTTYAVSITNTNASTSTTTGALTVSGGMGVGGSVYVGGSTLQVGSGPTGLIIQPMVGGSYGAIYSTNIVPSTTNYTFITDGASPNFNGTNGVFFNVNNVNKLQVYPTYLNVTPTTASTSTVTGALLVAGGVGVGGNVTVGGNLVLPSTGTATTSTFGYGSGVISLQNSVLFVSTSTTTTFNNGFTIQSLNSPSGSIYNSTLLVQSNNVYRSGGADSTFVQFNGGNTQLSVINNNDSLGIQFMETYATGYLGLINTSASANGVIPNNSFYLMFALANTGTIGTVVPRISNGTPNFRTIIDDGAGSVLIGAGTNFTTTGSLRINHTTPSTSTTTGALVVSGSAGIGGNFNVGGFINAIGQIQAQSNFVANSTTLPSLVLNAPGFYAGVIGPVSTQTWTIGWGNTGVYAGQALTWSTQTVTVPLTSATISTSSGALQVAGGVGVGGSLYVGNRVGWGSTGTSVAYQFYNQATGSMDMVFG